MKACGIGKTHRIQPVHGPHFGVARRSQQAVDDLLVSVRGLVVDECFRLVGRGWKPCEIERHPADQRAAIGFGRGRQLLAGQPRLNEAIDWIAARPRHFGDRRPLYRLIGPVSFVNRAFGDPAPDGLALRIREDFFGVLGRHPARRVRGEDALHDGALVRIAGHDRNGAGRRRLQRIVTPVEPHARHARALVGTVAAETGIRHDGPDVPIEFHRLRAAYRECSGHCQTGHQWNSALRVHHVVYVTPCSAARRRGFT